MIGKLVILTGASGAGKTTLAYAVEASFPFCKIYSFDSVGVPSAEVMTSFGTGHQPGGAWQRTITLEWTARIADVLKSGQSVLFEGQMRIAFVHEALSLYHLSHATVLLVDCDDQTRAKRLTRDRFQPELANEDTIAWSNYLRHEARDTGCEILDTSALSFREAVERIGTLLGGS